jgi:hypothetical protein
VMPLEPHLTMCIKNSIIPHVIIPCTVKPHNHWSVFEQTIRADFKLEQFLLAYKNSIFQDSSLYKQLWSAQRHSAHRLKFSILKHYLSWELQLHLFRLSHVPSNPTPHNNISQQSTQDSEQENMHYITARLLVPKIAISDAGILDRQNFRAITGSR